MYYLIAVVTALILHTVIQIVAVETVGNYLAQARQLLRDKRHTDGCTTPFKTYIHRWLRKSHGLCAAHDYGSLGFISGVRPGWHNNWVTWLAHMDEGNPVYWAWGTIVATVTLPWVVWRRNLGMTVLPFMVFHGMLVLGILVATAVIWSTYYQ